MKQGKLFLMLCIAGLYSFVSFGQGKNPVDYLSVPGPLSFDAKVYQLVWSAHPSENYYKQEYVVKGDNVARFQSMLLLEVAITDAAVKDIVSSKIAELKSMKASNPMVNYEMFEKNGEYILDFLLSANSPDGKTIDILERNVYRYKAYTGKDGKKGVILFAVSTRAYGKEADKFLLNLKATKSRLVNAIAQFSIPVILLKK